MQVAAGSQSGSVPPAFKQSKQAWTEACEPSPTQAWYSAQHASPTHMSMVSSPKLMPVSQIWLPPPLQPELLKQSLAAWQSGSVPPAFKQSMQAWTSAPLLVQALNSAQQAAPTHSLNAGSWNAIPLSHTPGGKQSAPAPLGPMQSAAAWQRAGFEPGSPFKQSMQAWTSVAFWVQAVNSSQQAAPTQAPIAGSPKATPDPQTSPLQSVLHEPNLQLW